MVTESYNGSGTSQCVGGLINWDISSDLSNWTLYSKLNISLKLKWKLHNQSARSYNSFFTQNV